MEIREMTDLTPQDFLDMAQSGKIELLERLAARCLELGNDYAQAAFEYYGAGGSKGATKDVAARYHKLDIQYDSLKHMMSAIQSSVRAERELSQ